MRRRLFGGIAGQPSGGGGGGEFGLTYLGSDFDAGNNSPSLSVSVGTATNTWLIIVLVVVGTLESGELRINDVQAPTPILISGGLTLGHGYLKTVVFAIEHNVDTITISNATYANGSAHLSVYRLNQDYNDSLILATADALNSFASLSLSAGDSVLGIGNARNGTWASPFSPMDVDDVDYNTTDYAYLWHENDVPGGSYAVSGTDETSSFRNALLAFSPPS